MWLIVGTKKIVGANHKVNLPKRKSLDGDWLGLNKLSDQPETFSKSCYEFQKKNYLTEFSTD